MSSGWRERLDRISKAREELRRCKDAFERDDTPENRRAVELAKHNLAWLKIILNSVF